MKMLQLRFDVKNDTTKYIFVEKLILSKFSNNVRLKSCSERNQFILILIGIFVKIIFTFTVNIASN